MQRPTEQKTLEQEPLDENLPEGEEERHIHGIKVSVFRLRLKLSGY